MKLPHGCGEASPHRLSCHSKALPIAALACCILLLNLSPPHSPPKSIGGIISITKIVVVITVVVVIMVSKYHGSSSHRHCQDPIDMLNIIAASFVQGNTSPQNRCSALYKTWAIRRFSVAPFCLQTNSGNPTRGRMHFGTDGLRTKAFSLW